MANKSQTSFVDLTEEMRGLKGFCDQIEGFRVSDAIIGDWKHAASLVEAGKEALAVEVAQKPIEGIRAILSAFIRNSVFAKPVPEGQTSQIPFFARLINERQEDGYDEDIIAGLRKKVEGLAQAVRTETNGTFEQRVSAYVVVKEAIAEADIKQKALDEKRRRGQWNVVKAVKKGGADGITEAIPQAERTRQADAARSIF